MSNSIYSKIISVGNLYLAYKNARKHKTKKPYVKKFEKNLVKNILILNKELFEQTYYPEPLKTFILRDPKTRKISKSAFKDRIVHHALVRVIELSFEKTFIYDCCANRIGKGSQFALKRFDKFKRKVTRNGKLSAFCLKADIKHYFEEVNHSVLINILKRKIDDEKVIGLIKQILNNFDSKEKGVGMPLGNLTSQFFANVYLNELDYFIKHELKIKYYIRYVDDFVILHRSKEQLIFWKEQIDKFLREKLKLELHSQKTKIIALSRGVDFVGFRNFYYFRLLRKRNVQNMKRKIFMFKQGLMNEDKFKEIFQGWNAYAKWANSYKLRIQMLNSI
jgi:retron-type reverse transcriptase